LLAAETPKYNSSSKRVLHHQRSRGPETDVRLWYPIYFHGAWHARRSGRNSKSTGTRLPLMNKAIWCFPMASAISHTHFTAHTFHMDIKPVNFVLDANKDLILIDWDSGNRAGHRCIPSYPRLTALGMSKRRGRDPHFTREQIWQRHSLYTRSIRVLIEKILPGVGQNGMSSQSGRSTVQEPWRQQRCSVSVDLCGCYYSK
jgi:serine/threonine protein kinase